jgi:hypothetical protein
MIFYGKLKFYSKRKTFYYSLGFDFPTRRAIKHNLAAFAEAGPRRPCAEFTAYNNYSYGFPL